MGSPYIWKLEVRVLEVEINSEAEFKVGTEAKIRVPFKLTFVGIRD